MALPDYTSLQARIAAVQQTADDLGASPSTADLTSLADDLTSMLELSATTLLQDHNGLTGKAQSLLAAVEQCVLVVRENIALVNGDASDLLDEFNTAVAEAQAIYYATVAGLQSLTTLGIIEGSPPVVVDTDNALTNIEGESVTTLTEGAAGVGDTLYSLLDGLFYRCSDYNDITGDVTWVAISSPLAYRSQVDSVASIAILRATPGYAGAVRHVLGLGTYDWAASGTVNGGSTVAASGGGYWVLRDAVVTPQHFGATNAYETLATQYADAAAVKAVFPEAARYESAFQWMSRAEIDDAVPPKTWDLMTATPDWLALQVMLTRGGACRVPAGDYHINRRLYSEAALDITWEPGVRILGSPVGTGGPDGVFFALPRWKPFTGATEYLEEAFPYGTGPAYALVVDQVLDHTARSLTFAGAIPPEFGSAPEFYTRIGVNPNDSVEPIHNDYVKAAVVDLGGSYRLDFDRSLARYKTPSMDVTIAAGGIAAISGAYYAITLEAPLVMQLKAHDANGQEALGRPLTIVTQLTFDNGCVANVRPEDGSGATFQIGEQVIEVEVLSGSLAEGATATWGLRSYLLLVEEPIEGWHSRGSARFGVGPAATVQTSLVPLLYGVKDFTIDIMVNERIPRGFTPTGCINGVVNIVGVEDLPDDLTTDTLFAAAWSRLCDMQQSRNITVHNAYMTNSPGGCVQFEGGSYGNRLGNVDIACGEAEAIVGLVNAYDAAEDNVIDRLHVWGGPVVPASMGENLFSACVSPGGGWRGGHTPDVTIRKGVYDHHYQNIIVPWHERLRLRDPLTGQGVRFGPERVQIRKTLDLSAGEVGFSLPQAICYMKARLTAPGATVGNGQIRLDRIGNLAQLGTTLGVDYLGEWVEFSTFKHNGIEPSVYDLAVGDNLTYMAHLKAVNVGFLSGTSLGAWWPAGSTLEIIAECLTHPLLETRLPDFRETFVDAAPANGVTNYAGSTKGGPYLPHSVHVKATAGGAVTSGTVSAIVEKDPGTGWETVINRTVLVAGQANDTEGTALGGYLEPGDVIGVDDDYRIGLKYKGSFAGPTEVTLDVEYMEYVPLSDL